MAWINIITPAQWGARYGKGWGTRKVPVRYTFLHHSDSAQISENASLETEKEAVRSIEATGYSRFASANFDGNGRRVWSLPLGAGISYTWLVAPSGRVYAGHDPRRSSSHTYGYNTSGVGIALIGNFETKAVTAKQIEAVARLLLQAKEDGIISTARLTGGHRDVVNTECPGDQGYKAISKINARAAELERGEVNVPVDTNKGFTTAQIKEAQTALKTLGYYSGAISGKLPDVDKAVRAFQTDNRLSVDGQPGANTMAVMRTRIAELEARKAREQSIVDGARIAGPDRWNTARLMGMASLPAGRGILIAADGSPDERYATARAGGEVRYFPVKAKSDTVPEGTLNAIKAYNPVWVRVVGGSNVVSDATARIILKTVGLI